MEYYIWFIFDFISVPKWLFYDLVRTFCDDLKDDSSNDLVFVTYFRGVDIFGFEVGAPHE